MPSNTSMLYYYVSHLQDHWYPPTYDGLSGQQDYNQRRQVDKNNMIQVRKRVVILVPLPHAAIKSEE